MIGCFAFVRLVAVGLEGTETVLEGENGFTMMGSVMRTNSATGNIKWDTQP